MSAEGDPAEARGREIAWVAHGRRDQPAPWVLGWDRARRPMLLTGGALALVVLAPAVVTADAGLVRAILPAGWLGLLLMIAGIWQPARLRRHAAWLTELRPPMDDADRDPAGCALASCTCGWRGPPRAHLDTAVADASAHAAMLDPDVERTIA